MTWLVNGEIVEPTTEQAAAIEAWRAGANVVTAADVIAERERRLAKGFNYDFGNGRGLHRIGSKPSDQAGWDEVTKIAQVFINLGAGSNEIDVVTDTGPVTITADEWQQILIAAAAFRQPIWAASFTLMAMDPIPANYRNNSHWQ